MLTRGIATSRLVTPVMPVPARVAVIPARVLAGGMAQVPASAPAGGSSATMPSLPPWYGSQTPVQPPALAERYRPPFMNGTLTWAPAAVVNGAGLVWLASNGVAQAACK